MVTAAVRYKESPLDVATWNFSAACGRISIDADLKSLLAMPYRELRLHLPVRLDDGTLRVFRAARHVHNNSRGPAAGCVRVIPGGDASLAEALARFNTWSAAIVQVPFGGACAVIDGDPSQLSAGENERLLRRLASRAYVVLGPYHDVLMAESEGDAGILLDEYSSYFREIAPASVTGKPADRGGIAHRVKAHPRAAAMVLRTAAQRLEKDLQNLRVAVYATSATAADYLAEFTSIGTTVIALSDGRSTAHDDRGLNPLAIAESVRQNGTVSAFPGTADSALAAECDVLVLASGECALHSANAGRVRASMVLEAAPLSITPSADAVLRQQRATVIPDLLASSGSLVAAHVEWAANLEQVQPHARNIELEFERLLPEATATVFERASRDHSSLRSAAYCTAIERVARTEKLRGV